MSRTNRYVFFTLGITSALGLAWFVRQRRREIDGLYIWQQVLIRRHGAEEAQRLMTAVRQQCAALIAETQMPQSPALQQHLKEHILPGLALYRVLLQEHNGDKRAALTEVDDAFRAWTLAKNRLMLIPLKILPAPFQIFKLAFNQRMKIFPFEGWDFTFIENRDDKVAFNATRCFYLNTLTAYGAPELTASFCKTDEVMAELFPPSIRFVRPHTLGRGDQVCDFQYCRMEQP
jgi:hypothetical protein